MPLVLQGTKVAIIPIFDPDKIGSIIVPDQAKERCDQGIVKYIGPDCESTLPGDYVFFSGYDGQLITLEGEGVLIFMHEEFIAAKITGEQIDETDVPGLFFQGTDGTYFMATYAMAMDFVARAFTDAPWRPKFNTRKMKRVETERQKAK